MKRIRNAFLQTLARRNGYRRCRDNTFVIRSKMFGDFYFEITQTGQARIK